MTAGGEEAILEAVLSRLRVSKGPDDRGEYVCFCPFHDDQHRPNLHVSERGYKCFACDAQGGLHNLARKLAIGRPPSPQGRTVYKYMDERGELLYEVVRFYNQDGEKDFYQRKPDGRGGFVKNVEDVRRVLYKLPELLARQNETVCIVEGEKDVHTLLENGLVATTNPGGAGKWLEEFNDALAGRDIAIIPDNDPPGRRHAQKVARQLLPVARSVRIVELPDLPEKGDVSDWIDAGGTRDELLRLVDEAKPLEAEGSMDDEHDDCMEEEEDGASSAPTNSAAISRWIEDTKGHRFARDGGGKLYVFEGGVYRPRGDRCVKGLVKQYFVAFGVSEKWRSHRAQEVVNFIEADAQELSEVPPLDRLNVLNGILNLKRYLETRDLGDILLVPHTPEHLSPIQIPVHYDPKAACPAWEDQVSSTFPADAQDLAWEVAGWLMVPCTSIQRALLLQGEGGTGKSTYLTGLRHFLGRRNVATKTLHRIEGNRFSVGGLFGKLANICADLPSQDLSGTAMFKAITGGDELTGEHKFLNEFSFVPFSRLIFSANRPPKSSDPSEAFFERWLVVPFDRKFRGEKGEIPRQTLDARLAAPKELSGLLNKALRALPKVLVEGMTVSDSMKAAHQAFRESTDPVLVWIQGNVAEHATAIVAKEDLLAAYNRVSAGKGRSVESEKAFTQALKRWNPALRDGQRTWRGKAKAWCWLGVGLRTDLRASAPELTHPQADTDDPSRDSQDSQGVSQFLENVSMSESRLGDGAQGFRTRKKGVNVVNVVNSGAESSSCPEGVVASGNGEALHPPSATSSSTLARQSVPPDSQPAGEGTRGSSLEREVFEL